MEYKMFIHKIQNTRNCRTQEWATHKAIKIWNLENIEVHIIFKYEVRNTKKCTAHELTQHIRLKNMGFRKLKYIIFKYEIQNVQEV